MAALDRRALAGSMVEDRVMTRPVLLRGMAEIAQHLCMSARYAEHLHQQDRLPTFKLTGESAPHATDGGRNEWSVVRSGSW